MRILRARNAQRLVITVVVWSLRAGCAADVAGERFVNGGADAGEVPTSKRARQRLTRASRQSRDATGIRAAAIASRAGR
jgi:hypothetical protein